MSRILFVRDLRPGDYGAVSLSSIHTGRNGSLACLKFVPVLDTWWAEVAPDLFCIVVREERGLAVHITPDARPFTRKQSFTFRLFRDYTPVTSVTVVPRDGIADVSPQS